MLDKTNSQSLSNIQQTQKVDLIARLHTVQRTT